ncbi:MAG: DUF2167 domain-containing protein [Cytophagales bacterium]|nr:DUF2167 domain-containing protein [Cytophagales bacterium]
MKYSFKSAGLFLLMTLSFTAAFAIGDTTEIAEPVDSNQIYIQQIENSLVYQTGTIKLGQGNATLTVPKGFKYLDPKQSIYVLSDLWGNPVDSSVLGLLVPEGKGVMGEESWVFNISYDAIGYVKDDDADDIDYDELLQEQQREILDANPERIKQGFEPITFVGWASKPYYDSEKKVLHWAKELKFGENTNTTLNYNLRILGRKGVFVLNAIANTSQLTEVQASIDNVLGSVSFDKGSSYFDFDPDVDEVAAWTIGSLVAGKILAKVGFFAILLKFWKIIGIGLIAGISALWKFITGKKEDKPVVSKSREENKPEGEES